MLIFIGGLLIILWVGAYTAQFARLLWQWGWRPQAIAIAFIDLAIVCFTGGLLWSHWFSMVW